jgi:hypothetical protein
MSRRRPWRTVVINGTVIIVLLLPRPPLPTTAPNSSVDEDDDDDDDDSLSDNGGGGGRRRRRELAGSSSSMPSTDTGRQRSNILGAGKGGRMGTGRDLGRLKLLLVRILQLLLVAVAVSRGGLGERGGQPEGRRRSVQAHRPCPTG